MSAAATDHAHLTVAQLAAIARTLELILAVLDRGDEWGGAGFFREHQEGGDVRPIQPPANVGAPVELMPANMRRRQVLIYNASSAAVYVLYGKQVTTSNYTLQIAPGGLFVCDNYAGPLWGVWAAAATGPAIVTEV